VWLQGFHSQVFWPKIKLILNPEYPFYISSIIYGIGVSVLTLAIPISVQSLVNTVAFGVLTQPLVVLSIVLLLLLLFSGVLNALQVYVIELFQRRFFARTTLEVTQKLLKSSHEFVYQQNAVEFTNRFFDVMTVQKSFTTLITGGVAVILQTLVGLILLAFYHPYFLVFDILLIISLYYIWALFWRDALGTAVVESKAKYKVASWLEEVARENLFFKSNSRMEYALKVSDKNVIHYLDSRSKHFKTVFYQTILLLGTYALMSSLILGLGGYLVIEGQLTLGQLVAAELVVTVILASFSKAGKFLESFYDLFAAIDKLSQFYDLKPSVKQRKIGCSRMSP
jgi:putative ABC transport system ATP-binding protein